MAWYIRVALGLLCSVWIPMVVGQETPVKPKGKVEIYWLEYKPIKGLTEEKGFTSSCDPKSLVYQHKKPAMVLTAAEVTEARLTNHDFSKNGLSSENYMVTLHLTKTARGKLAESCEGNETRDSQSP